jgi:hypothetical protein
MEEKRGRESWIWKRKKSVNGQSGEMNGEEEAYRQHNGLEKAYVDYQARCSTDS